jgi:TPR repeat protein
MSKRGAVYDHTMGICVLKELPRLLPLSHCFLRWVLVSFLMLAFVPLATADADSDYLRGYIDENQTSRNFGLIERSEGKEPGLNEIARVRPTLLPPGRVTSSYQAVHVLSHALPLFSENSELSSQIVDDMNNLLTIRSTVNLRALDSVGRAINLCGTLQVAYARFKRDDKRQFTVAFWDEYFTARPDAIVTARVKQTIHTRATAAAIGIALCHDDHTRYNLIEAIQMESGIKAQVFANFLAEIARVAGRNIIIPECLKLSRKQTDGVALVNLGIHYQGGFVVEINPQQVLAYFEQARQRGNRIAQCKIADMRVREDKIDEAKRLYSEIADRCPYAQFQLGVLCEGEDDYKNAAVWYSRAAEQEYSSAQVRLGGILENGLGSVKKDEKAAASWYRKAAEQGDPAGRFSLGRMRGDGGGETVMVVQSHHQREKSFGRKMLDGAVYLGTGTLMRLAGGALMRYFVA